MNGNIRRYEVLWWYNLQNNNTNIIKLIKYSPPKRLGIIFLLFLITKLTKNTLKYAANLKHCKKNQSFFCGTNFNFFFCCFSLYKPFQFQKNNNAAVLSFLVRHYIFGLPFYVLLYFIDIDIYIEMVYTTNAKEHKYDPSDNSIIMSAFVYFAHRLPPLWLYI